jgi:tetratricopeptide (TPR) repeat protein
MQDSANALELSRRQYANFAEFDKAREGWEKTKTEIETNLGKLQAESVEKAEALAKWEKANDEIQITLANREKSVEAGEQELAVKVEKEKSLSLSRQNRWNDAEKAQQKKHEDEDAKRQLRTLKILGDVDALAGAVYNASSFEINNQLQEKLIALLAPILDYVNLRPTVDSLNRYVPMSDRNLPGIEIKETGRDVLSIPSDGELPANIRACFKVTVKVFNFLNKEPQLGRDFCTRMKATAQKLQELVRGKSDDELIASKERILVFFNAFHKNMTLLAGNYQEAKGDFQAESDWLHSQAIFLEKKIGVGVYQDGFLPLAHPKRKNNR